MVKGKKAVFIGLILGIVLSSQAAAQINPRIYLYLIQFDNIKNEESLGWLRSAFPDMLSEYYKSNKNIQLKNQANLEEIMNNRNLLFHQSRGVKNFLVLGKFQRQLDLIQIQVQVINIANWEEIGNKKISGEYANIPGLNKLLIDALESLLQPYIPAKTVPAFPAIKEPEPFRPDPGFATSSKATTKSIDAAIDRLEESLEFASGYRQKPPERFEDAEGEWVLDLNVDNEFKPNPENDENTDLLKKVVDNLTNHPYSVSLKKPEFILDKENRDEMVVQFPVTYTLKESIIKDMLVSLPYSGLRQEGSLTIFYFNKDKFNFPDEFIERIQQGKYRAIPVIVFLDKKKAPKVVIVDSPESAIAELTSKKVLYIPTHSFSPLIDFTLGGWSLQVTMETVDIPVNYQFRMAVSQIPDLEKVSLKFIPENELTDYLKTIL